MWPDIPEQRLLIVKQRQAELRDEAAANRSARKFAPDRSFSGLRLHVGSLIIVVGRTLSDDNPSPHPIRF